ncbi:hypothetical protein ACFQZO_29180 [Bradyrhizobium sp. GCM10027634]|uniref:hypothetical protein n=1 Tax=unclassified Bradyrhizobium TaxID=2631580 RepID=UPI00188CABFC|nr:MULTISPECIES: hypothetical protein [unclassified Bradyrhizobium]MDN5004930.1 hypothetical protein [Bradyrhizobium sp. WYCCWR 12677]QOZ45151.1 hypothetical protein XH89_17955 [Bradyrhizobium sp. CCBAU 53340]
MIRNLAVTALIAIVSPALAQTVPPQEGPITCVSPIARDDTEASLKQRYGKDAVVQELPGAEGETYKGLVLFPKAMDRRIEIGFADDKAGRASGLILRDTAKTSRWSVSGITIGSSLADLQKANGKPFLVADFEWDYGGFVTDWKGGTLGHPLQGGCTVTIRFDRKSAAPKSLLGDGVKVASDNATLVKWAPVVTEIGVNFPDK